MERSFTIKSGLVVVAAALAAGLAAASCSTPRASGAGAVTGNVARGQYIVSTAGCHDCHTPMKMGADGPEPDMSRALSGHPEQFVVPPPPALSEGWLYSGAVTGTAYYGPWGISFAANLTPDQNTGLGIWTEDMFMRAIREGRHMGTSRQILPPMPWTVYRNLTDDDLKAVYAYLRTVKPITNHVPDPVEPVAPMLTERQSH